MTPTKEFILIFFMTVLILVVGISFGYDQINNPYEISEETRSLSVPFEGEVDRVFLESLAPAL